MVQISNAPPLALPRYVKVEVWTCVLCGEAFYVCNPGRCPRCLGTILDYDFELARRSEVVPSSWPPPKRPGRPPKHAVSNIS